MGGGRGRGHNFWETFLLLIKNRKIHIGIHLSPFFAIFILTGGTNCSLWNLQKLVAHIGC